VAGFGSSQGSHSRKKHTVVKVKVKLKVKVQPRTDHENPEGSIERYSSFLNLGTRWGGWSTPRPGPFTPGKDPVPFV
jgi:hypothetical protein